MSTLRILVPMDFSPSSRNALAVAAGWARRGHGELYLAHVVDRPGEILSRAEDDLASLILPDDTAVADRRVVVGRAADAILDLAARSDTDLIVMGATGRSPIGRLLLGSVAAEVVRRATGPVVCVPRGAAALHEPGRIVCAADFSEPSRRAMACALPLARRLALPMTILHTFEAPVMSDSERPAMGDDVLAEMRAAVEPMLAALRAEVEAGGVRAATEVAVGPAAGEILRAAHAAPCDLVVMATHGRSGFARVALGSVTEKVLAGASCPVLTIGPGFVVAPGAAAGTG